MYYVLGVNCANLAYIHIEETAKVGVFMIVEAILLCANKMSGASIKTLEDQVS